ncbi:MAG: TetR/AcrR family transcriptional regulator [Rhizobiaceae bacterium]|nr:TetR/AcrR family transcriptional regulator [Rhizobiaceae bacterium]
MTKRADASRETRERIMNATMQLHDEKGVARTTFADIAKRAGIGQATLYRHFPSVGDLVQACGGHVWVEMRPLTPDNAAVAFKGLTDPTARLEKLVDEVDAFFSRGELRLHLAGRDRELVPELDQFLSAVEAGISAYVGEALAPMKLSKQSIAAVNAVMSFPMWQQLRRMKLPAQKSRQLTIRLISCAIGAAQDL